LAKTTTEVGFLPTAQQKRYKAAWFTLILTGISQDM
jgi:hypothetical protein